jgi:hypothetical protein
MSILQFTALRITAIGPVEVAFRRTARSALDLQADRVEACKTCPKPVWFTAFFDGTGNNYEMDGRGGNDSGKVKYSNVAKLAWFAHVVKHAMPRTTFEYIEGVGTPCSKEGVNDSGKGLDSALGMAAASKGEARIRWMLRMLKNHVDEHMPFVNQINLAVFGFSRGATQARAFTRLLSEVLADWDDAELLWKQAGLNGKRPRVVVYFMGLFDTVSSTGFGGSRAEALVKDVGKTAIGATAFMEFAPWILPKAEGMLNAVDQGGHAAWAYDLAIPPYVSRCVHFVAGQEVREKFPGESIRRHDEMPINSVERVYPGMHSDVGGGYGSADPAYQEGRCNELARIPLCHMYIEAYKAGVPLDAPDDVLARAGSLFDISPELERVFNSYTRSAPSWVNERLETAVVWHMQHYYEWRESRRRRMNDGRLKIVTVDKFMSITDREWWDDVQAIARSQTGYFRSAVGVKESAIFDAYKHKLFDAMAPQQRADFDLLFDHYVHDSIAGFKKQMSEAHSLVGLTERSRWSVNRKYFMGKRGDKLMYWRYESDKTAYAGIKFDCTDRPENEDSPEAQRARQGELESKDFQRTR